MSEVNSFSARNGISAPPQPQLGEAPQSVRYWIFQYLHNEHPESPLEAAEVLANFLRQPTFVLAYSISDHHAAWRKMQIFLKELEWWKVYDLLEFIGESLKFGKKQYISMLNSDLAIDESCYRMNDRGQIVFAGDPAIEGSVSRAETTLALKGKYPAKNEIRKAMEALSKRPKPDLTAAVQHVLTGLEIATRNFTGDHEAPFRDVIANHPETFPAPVGEAISLLYEYTAVKAKQAAENDTFNPAEVELVVGIAANLATYLNR